MLFQHVLQRILAAGILRFGKNDFLGGMEYLGGGVGVSWGVLYLSQPPYVKKIQERTYVRTYVRT